MKKQKHQHSTSTKFRFLDFLTFISVSGFAIFAIYITMPRDMNFLTIGLFLAIGIPTIIALVQGAPFVPTPMRAVRKMLATAGIKKGDNVIDIGCGDGRLCYLASKEFGAKAIGYELSPVVYLIAKIRQLLWKSKAKIKYGDFRRHDLSDADHIVTYMLPETLEKFIPKFEKDLKKGARVTSYAFHIGKWAPVHVEPSCKDTAVSKIWVYEIGKHNTE
jgi:SAM-dependent methyltransferase